MKRFKELLLLLALLAAPLASEALDVSIVSGIRPRLQTFITNNTTVLFGYTNIQFIAGNQNLYWSLNTNSIFPTFVGGTTVNGVNYGGTAYWTNTITTNTITAGTAWDDLQLWPNRNADSALTPVCLYVSAMLDNGTGNTPTNMLTLIFAKMSGTNVDVGNTLTLPFALTGTTNQFTTTNLGSIFQIGATGVRLISAKTANSTTNSFVQLLDFGLSGFKP